jgi:8-oxo-dGTP pyrophosphatase MutT (NUDIX family)
MRERLTARILLLDPEGRILLMKGRLPSTPDAPGAWFTVGGGVEPGESLAEAARREIAEETGFEPQMISPVLWEGEQIHHDDSGAPFRVLERFMVARCAGGEPSRQGWQTWEHAFVDDIRWWTLAELGALTEPIFPPDLARRLAAVLADPEFSGGSSAPG